MRLNELGELAIDFFGLFSYVIREIFTIHIVSDHAQTAVSIWNGVARNLFRERICGREKP